MSNRSIILIIFASLILSPLVGKIVGCISYHARANFEHNKNNNNISINEQKSQINISQEEIMLWVEKKITESESKNKDLLSSLEPKTEGNTVYRQAEWGMSIEEVKELEANQDDVFFLLSTELNVGQQQSQALGYLLYLADGIFATLGYEFGNSGKRLNTISISLQGASSPDTDIENIINTLKLTLQKYGKLYHEYKTEDEVMGAIYKSQKLQIALLGLKGSTKEKYGISDSEAVHILYTRPGHFDNFNLEVYLKSFSTATGLGRALVDNKK